MLSQNTLVWVGGATASTVVAAGAVAGAMLWTHPGFLWPSPAATQVVASAPEPKTPTVPPRLSRPRRLPQAPRRLAATRRARRRLAAQADFRRGERRAHGRSGHRRPGAPKAKVELRDAGETVAEATADASGQFVIIPPALAPGDHSLSLAAGAGKAARKRPAWSRSLFPGRKRRSLRPPPAPVTTAAPAPAAP